jgi:tetratricopeptide (TPR) repeat protein
VSDSYLERAELLADLGRYEEAAQELAWVAPTDVAAATMLARIRLSAGAPRDALAATEAAVEEGAADPGLLIARGMALAELGRVDEAAGQAEQILRIGAGDARALASAAVILAMVRNGQVALDAAWEAVRLAPEQPRSHLVLGLVAGGLGLAEIAERAYREALALDPGLPVTEAAVGVARWELYRYAIVLGRLTGAGGTRPAGTHRLGEGLRGLFRGIRR